MINLTMIRFGSLHVSQHATIESAAVIANIAVDCNESAPVSIEDNGQVVWTNTGPFDGSYDELQKLANVN